MSQAIRITCKGHTTVPYTDLVPYQGTLKELSVENYGKLKASILREGFCAPVFAWQNEGKLYTLDGHQRLRTLTKMAQDGYTIPDIPVDYIEADTVQDAKRKILALTSQFGTLTGDGLYEFLSEAELPVTEMENFNFPEIDLAAFRAEFVENEIPARESTDLTGDMTKAVEVGCPECGHRFIP